MEPIDVALEEYRSLRAEILAHIQAQSTVVSVALTATAAVAGFAFGTTNDDQPRYEILLALPLVLGGLALFYMAHGQGAVHIGSYIRCTLWPRVQALVTPEGKQEPAITSWEKVVAGHRGLVKGATSVRGWLSFLPGLIIFAAPSVAALVINRDDAWMLFLSEGSPTDLGWAWFSGCVITGMAGLLLVLAGMTRVEPAPDAGFVGLAPPRQQLQGQGGE